jgi:cellulose synthase/poly-beta-1,6-N-acetylglucosamine synthase-like glycosyltransferase
VTLSIVPSQRKLGDLLVERGLLTEDGLARALDVQERTGDRLGSIVMALGLVKRRDLYGVLADLWHLPFADLLLTPPDTDLIQRFDRTDLVNLRFIPMRHYSYGFGEEVLLVAISDQPSQAIEEACYAKLGAHNRIEFFVTTDWDIDKVIGDVFRDELIATATMGLYYRNPEESAFRPFRRWQVTSLAIAATLLVIGLFVVTSETLVLLSILVNGAFLSSIVFKAVTSIAGSLQEATQGISQAELDALDDRDLPMYTILVPVFREANIVGMLMDNLRNLDYPASKLEILLLIEEVDKETLEAARAAKPPETVTFVIIPDGQPRTKPRACNVGLFFARGEYLVIYDAEDRPEPDQLRKAVVAFQKGGDKLVCVQAALNYFNATENFLTRMFTLEYSYWFDYMLPGLDRLNLPIPLGGTHFRTETLRKLGGWDPFNVTEDADLGIRASAEGYTIGVINSTTYEEANRELGNWIRQRSRWIKGYMQTTLVYLRNPIDLVRRVGLKNALGFAMLIGGTPLTFLATMPMLLLFLAWLVLGVNLDALFPGELLYVGMFNLFLGNSIMVLVNMFGVVRRRNYGLTLFSLANPLYWMLHSIASYKALWQLITKPFYWEKTNHGLTKQPNTPTPEPIPFPAADGEVPDIKRAA